LPDTCGKKRVNRCYNKLKQFFHLYNKTSSNSLSLKSNLTKFIVPIFLYHKNLINKNDIELICSNNQISGFLIFMENYKKLDFMKLVEYKNFVHKELNAEIFVRAGQGHPSNLNIV
jgi:hypothetical protein